MYKQHVALCRTAVLALGMLSAALLTPTDAFAQRPIGSGTAAGFGASAMTEARMGESVLWNPALILIPDVPSSSFGLLHLDLEGQTDASVRRIRALIGEEQPDSSMLESESAGINSAARFGVMWAGWHAKNTGFSLTTRGTVLPNMTARTVDLLQGPVEEFPTEAELDEALSLSSSYNVSTTMAVSTGEYLGRIPLLGYTWTAGAVKLSRIHHHGRGGVRYGDADWLTSTLYVTDAPPEVSNPRAQGLVSDFFEVHNGYVLGTDLGVVFNPTGTFLISVNGVNLYQEAKVDLEDIYLRQAWMLGRENGKAGYGQASALVDVQSIRDAGMGEELDQLVDEAHFFRVVRLGAAVDFNDALRVGVAAGRPLEEGDAIGKEEETRFGVSGSFRKLPLDPRISFVERMDGTRVYSLGAERVRCGGRTSLAATYLEGASRGFGVSFAHTFGPKDCSIR